MEHIIHTVLHVGLETLKIIPFLFVTYLLLEYVEHKSEEKAEHFILNNKKTGPLVGGLAGLVPQCGFSAAAAGLWSGGIISVGTLLAVFLSTSDEMIAVLFSRRVPVRDILLILGFKLVVAVAAGFLTDILWKRQHRSDIEHHCQEEGCHCEEKGIFLSALYHTVKIIVFIFIISVAVHIVKDAVGNERLASLFSAIPFLSNFVSALIGLVPNCAVSVVLAELYVEGIISAGSMISGLLVGAGAGLLVLLRVNRSSSENLKFIAILFFVGALGGLLFDLVGLGAFLS